MTRLSLLTDQRCVDDSADLQDSPEPGQKFCVVSRFLCQRHDRRGDEANYHGFVSKIELRQPMISCAVNIYCPERDNCKSDQHCWPNGVQRHALVIDFQDIMTTRILFHPDLDSNDEIVRPCSVAKIALPASTLWWNEKPQDACTGQVSFSYSEGSGDV